MEKNQSEVAKEILDPGRDRPIVEQDDFDLMMQPRWVTIHCVARCQDCDFYADDFLTAWDEANEHCDDTGHQVTVEKGVATSKDYRWGEDDA